MRRRVCLPLLAALAIALASATASAQEASRPGKVNVMVKAGVGSYTGDLSPITDAGPTWGVLLNLQPTRMLGLEVAYDGSRNGVEGIVGDTALLRNGGSAMFKFGLPLLERYRPFLGAGLGASYVSVQGVGPLVDGDVMQEVPFTAGFEFNTRRVTAGVRATYRYLVNEGFARPVGNPQGGMFDTSVTVGGRF